MTPDPKKQRAKNYRQLHKEYQRLCRQHYHAPLCELDEPFFRGYERFFVLTEKAQQREDADKLAFVLEYFQAYQFCRKSQFRTGKPSGRRWAKGEIGAHLIRRPTFDELVSKSFPRALYPHLKSRFLDFQNPLPPYRRLKTYQKHQKLSFRNQSLLRSHTQPHLVTHLPLHDPELEARLSELYRLLWQGDRQGEVSKALYRKHWRRCYPSREQILIREDYRHKLHEANSDPSIKSAVSPRFFVFFITLFPSTLS